MNQTQILKISDKYASILLGMGAKAQKYDTSLHIQPGSLCAYDHCLWMCGEIERVEGDPEKALRWICFVQGVLWGAGILNVDSMREDNRLILGKST